MTEHTLQHEATNDILRENNAVLTPVKLSYSTRLLKLALVWNKYGLDEVLFSAPWLKAFRVMLFANPLYWFRKKNQPRGEQLRAALEELGPLYIKFGQILSTRRDLLPDEIALALAKLQDQVQPFDHQLARTIIEKSLGATIEQTFSEFSQQPLASASIAQVHAATLKTGETVVIKVLRPQIEKIVKKDIALLYLLARFAQRWIKGAHKFRPIEMVAEVERTILDELDLLREAANASQLKRHFKQRPELYIPEVYWPYCRKNMMVMERIHGIPVSDIPQLDAHGINRQALAELGIQLFYTQVFRDCFFHADMHPGNLFVSSKYPDSPRYIAVDFGIVGSLSDEDKHYLAANFLAFFHRDYRRVAQLHIESGWVSQSTREQDFEAAIRTVCEPIFEKPLNDISMGQTLLRLFQIAKRFDMNIQPQLLLLQKTLLNIEGIGRTLYPDLDLWKTAKPLLEQWMKEQVGTKGLLKRLKNQLPDLSERLPELPELIYQKLKQPTANNPSSTPSKKPQKPRWRATLFGLGLGLLLTVASIQIPPVSQWITSHSGIAMMIVIVLWIIVSI